MTKIIRIDGIDYDVDQVSLTFNGIKVGGLPVPNMEVVEAMLKTMSIPTQMIFSAASNRWAEDNHLFNNPREYILNCDPSVVEELKLRERLIEIDKIECGITGFSFNQMRYVRAILSWHEMLRGNDTSAKITDRQKGLSKLKKVAKGENDLSSFRSFIKGKDHQRLMRFDENLTFDEYLPCYEYLQAFNYRRRFSNAVDDLILTSSEIRSLVAERADIYLKLMAKAEADPLSIPYLFCCPFCKECRLITNGKTPKSCRFPKCDGAYSAKTSRLNSNQPHAANRRLSLPSKAFQGAPTICTGCGKKRVIYKFEGEDSCKSCHERVS